MDILAIQAEFVRAGQLPADLVSDRELYRLYRAIVEAFIPISCRMVVERRLFERVTRKIPELWGNRDQLAVLACMADALEATDRLPLLPVTVEPHLIQRNMWNLKIEASTNKGRRELSISTHEGAIGIWRMHPEPRIEIELSNPYCFEVLAKLAEEIVLQEWFGE